MLACLSYKCSIVLYTAVSWIMSVWSLNIKGGSLVSEEMGSQIVEVLNF